MRTQEYLSLQFMSICLILFCLAQIWFIQIAYQKDFFTFYHSVDLLCKCRCHEISIFSTEPSQARSPCLTCNGLVTGCSKCNKDFSSFTVHYVHFVKYDDAVSFYDTVSDTIRRRVETGAYSRKKGWIQWHILGEITDLEFENH